MCNDVGAPLHLLTVNGIDFGKVSELVLVCVEVTDTWCSQAMVDHRISIVLAMLAAHRSALSRNIVPYDTLW